MAVSNLDEGVQKHQKVYSFLKRTLPQERYEGVRVIEPCVVVAEGFKTTFQFAVLGDEMLYITENPPRAPKDIKLQLDLACVTSVELIHDCADFLGGDLKTKNQHILIIYKKITKSQSSSTSSSQSLSVPGSENRSSTKLALQASFLVASPVLKLEALEQGSNKSPILQPRGLIERVESQPSTTRYLSVQTNRMHLSASESDLRNLRLIDEKEYSSSASNLKENLHSPMSRRPLPPPPPGYETVATKSSSNFRARSGSADRKKPSTPYKQRRKPKQDYDLNSSSSSSELELSSYQSLPRSFCRQNSADSSNRYRPVSPDPALLENGISRHRSNSSESTGSCAEFVFHSDDDDNDDSVVRKVETAELHLYILTEDSPMFVHLRSTWNNCILKSTLRFGKKKTSLTSLSSRTSSKVDNSQLLELFYQLKTEILKSHRMEPTFVLLQELLTGAQKNFNLKKYFWKSPDLFLFMVGQLQLYMPQSPGLSSKKRGNNREDELDFVVVLLDMLVCLFRETDALSTRLIVVKASKGQAVKELLKTIIVHPLLSLLPGEANISQAAQKLLSGTDGSIFTVGREAETKKLLNETLDSATSLLYELMCAVHQANCFSSKGNVLNICWLVKILESQEQMKNFVQRMMDRLTSTVSSSDGMLSPTEAVLLYRQLFLLKNFMEYSPIVASQIRVGYAEEFRYYIRKPVVKKKLPSKYPLTSPTIKLLERVTDQVLNKTVQQSFR